MDRGAVAAKADAVPLHTASVPVCLHDLRRLSGWLDAAEALARGTAWPIDTLLQARRASDMLPLHARVAKATHFTLRACFPLARQPVPPWAEHPATLDGMRADRRRPAPAAEAGAGGFQRVPRVPAGGGYPTTTSLICITGARSV